MVLWAILQCKQSLTKGILLPLQLFFILEGEDKPLCSGLLTKPVLKLVWAFLDTHSAANSSPDFTLLRVQTVPWSQCGRNAAKRVHFQLQPEQVAILWPCTVAADGFQGIVNVSLS